MKRSELEQISKDVTNMHLDDLKKELPEIIENSIKDAKSSQEMLISLIINTSANSIEHSVQAVTDVLANVGLLEVEDD